MKFLKLLDPRMVTVDGPGLTIREQSLRARQLFPSLVAESQLAYAKRGTPAPAVGFRWLIAVAPTFSLHDMRFADILNESTKTLARDNYHIEIFDIDDSDQGRLLPDYFPHLSVAAATPIAGLWEDGRHVGNWSGGEAMNRVFQSLGIASDANAVGLSVRPPSSALMEE